MVSGGTPVPLEWGGRTILAQHLTGHDLLVEVGFALLHAARKSLLLGIVDQCLDGRSLTLGRGLGFLLLGTRLSALVPPEVAAEFSLVSALVVEVGNVCLIPTMSVDGAGVCREQ
jgi:hypothetical protein